MVSSLLPFKNAHYRPPFNQSFRHQPASQRHLQAQFNEIAPYDTNRFTVTRNFNSNGAGRTFLQQNFDPRMAERNADAPLRSSNYNIQTFPSGLM